MKRISFFAFALLFSPLAAFGSGQALVAPGQEVRIQAETVIPDAELSWIVYRDETETDSLAGNEFVYSFAEPGQYQVVLLAENKAGQSERSTADIFVTENRTALMPLRANLASLPPVDPMTGVAYVSPARPVVVLFGAESEGDIVEYRYDFDIALDSDKDGDPANDADNASHPSFSTGGAWGVNMKNVDNPVTARLIVKDRQGNTHSKDITFQADSRGNASKPIAASLASLPPADSSGTIRLSGESQKIVFYFGESAGQISQFRFDRSLRADSNGDGDPANDTDNHAHPSLTRSEPLQVEFKKSEGVEQYVQLTTVDATGTKGSRVKRKIVFGEPQSYQTPPLTVALAPRIWADYQEVPAGTPVTFYVMGVPAEAVLSWDFDADGTPDKSGTETIAQHKFETAGEYTVKVVVTADGDTKELSETITVTADEGGGAYAPPTADFVYTLGNDGVTFTNSSAADPRLSDRGLSFAWDFGDGETSTDANPLHAYREAGAYTVTLTVTDADGKSSSKAVSIEVAPGTGVVNETGATTAPDETPAASPTASEEPSGEDGESPLIFLLKTLFFILLILVLLGGGYFVYRKIKDPDLSFGEIIDHDLGLLTRGNKPHQPEGMAPPAPAPMPLSPEPAASSAPEIMIEPPFTSPISAPVSPPTEEQQPQTAAQPQPSAFAEMVSESTSPPPPPPPEPQQPIASTAAPSDIAPPARDAATPVAKPLPDWLPGAPADQVAPEPQSNPSANEPSSIPNRSSTPPPSSLGSMANSQPQPSPFSTTTPAIEPLSASAPSSFPNANDAPLLPPKKSPVSTDVPPSIVPFSSPPTQPTPNTPPFPTVPPQSAPPTATDAPDSLIGEADILLPEADEKKANP